MFTRMIYNDNSVYDHEEWLKRRKSNLRWKRLLSKKAFIKTKKKKRLKLTSHSILNYLRSADLLINLLMLFSIDYVNIYLFSIYFSID